MNSKRYEAYILRPLKIKLKGIKNAYLVITKDTKVLVDPVSHLAYYRIYDVCLNKIDYQIVN